MANKYSIMFVPTVPAVLQSTHIDLLKLKPCEGETG